MKKLNLGLLIAGLALSICRAQNGLMVTTVANLPGFGVRQLVQGNDGALYGCLGSGGTSGLGAVIRVTLSGSLTTLVSFGGANGSYPQSPPILAPDEFFYGTTGQGGNYNYGTLYRMDSNGFLTTFYSFDQTNGASPGPLTLDNDGSIYGVTFAGGPNFTNVNHGDGTIFKITTNGDFTLKACFNGTNGYAPECLIQASDGNFYGVTGGGGIDDSHGQGTVFRMSPDGQLTNLAVFNGTNGKSATFIMQASDGCLYGTTGQGGPPAASGGVVFKITTNGDFAFLASFNGTNGAGPFGLTEVSKGVFYGVTESAGISGAKHKGTLFQVTTNGSLTKLLSFGVTPGMPATPVGPLTEASDGNYYGYSGQPNSGTVYSIRPIQAPVLQSAPQAAKFNFSWNAWVGYTYNVMYETNLNGSNWNLLSTVTPQTNGPTSFSDSIGPDMERFYQVVLQLP